MKLVFCHGLDSGPHGRKYHAMVDAGLDVHAPDFRGQNLEARIRTLLDEIGESSPPLSGSSYGGLVAVCAVVELSLKKRIMPGMLLLAPALHLKEPPTDRLPLMPLCPTHIIHGIRDEIVPLAASHRFAANDRHLVTVQEVDDDHSLAASMDIIVDAARQLAGEPAR